MAYVTRRVARLKTLVGNNENPVSVCIERNARLDLVLILKKRKIGKRRATHKPTTNVQNHRTLARSKSVATVSDSDSDSDASSSASTRVAVRQQAVALVSPRQHESAPQNVVAPQQMADQSHAASTCTSASSSTSADNQSQSMSTHNTTSQDGRKRPRDNETDSTEDISSDHGQTEPRIKTTRTQIDSSTSQRVSESSFLDVDYQVTTSSQRDQDDESLAFEVSESDEEMLDNGPVHPDDGIQFEDEADNAEAFEEEAQGESIDMHAETLQSDSNEANVVNSSEPNQFNPNASTSLTVSAVSSEGEQVSTDEILQPQEISANDSGSGAPSTSSWHVPAAQNVSQSGDDNTAPITPTSYVPRHADDFNQAVSSPQPHHQSGQQQNTKRVTFAEPETRTSEGIDDTRIDLSQLDESGGRNMSTIASQSPGDASVTIPAVKTIEPTAGPSAVEEANVPQILVDEVENDNASTAETDKNKANEVIDAEEGIDGVSSEGEKTSGGAKTAETEEESREAEVASTHQTRSSRGRESLSPYQRGGRSARDRPQPNVDGSSSNFNSFMFTLNTSLNKFSMNNFDV